MEQDMKLNPSIIRRLREARNWSQEQLATAAGLSLRTIQRVETEGAASRETRVCLAAALDTEVSAIVEARHEAAGASTGSMPTGSLWWAMILAGGVMLAAGLLPGVPRVVDYCAILLVSFGVLGHSWKR